MTALFRTPEILDLLTLNIRDASGVARALVGAQGHRLHLGAEIEWARTRLSAAGVALAEAPLAEMAEDAEPFWPRGLRRLPMPPGSPTDCVDIGLDLGGRTGPAAAMLELGGVPAGWATRDHLRGLEQIRSLLTGQIEALLAGPGIVAATLLRLVTLLRELDDKAASHSLAGLLTVLADKQPSRVEVMAMRICGLAGTPPARGDGTHVVLSDVALDLLEQAGLGRTTQGIGIVAVPDGAAPSMEVVAPQTLVPFARARIVERDYDVAEDDQSGHLWFRTAGTQDAWAVLANTCADGWTAIAAEILGQTSDITVEFAQMHLIRRRDLPTDQVAEAYELDGTIWWLREGESGTEGRLHGGDWQPCAVDRDLPVKKRALAALLQIDPHHGDRLTDQVREWARRMAHAVQVVPYLAIAAE
jgi:hypothetical protein